MKPAIQRCMASLRKVERSRRDLENVRKTLKHLQKDASLKPALVAAESHENELAKIVCYLEQQYARNVDDLSALSKASECNGTTLPTKGPVYFCFVLNTSRSMRREYIEYVGRTKILRVPLSMLPRLLDEAVADPEGEQIGLAKLSKRIGVPPPQPDCCVTCGGVIATYGMKDGPPQWCYLDKPAEAVYRLPEWKKRELLRDARDCRDARDYD